MNRRLFTQSAAFFFELKRRKVFRVAFVYAAVTWILLQAAALIFPALHLPDWTVTLFVVFAIFGFPIALLLAWAYDITPEGIERTPAPANPRAEPDEALGATGRIPAPPAIVRPPTAPEAPARTVAVLPLINLSHDEDNEYFADGMTEELINVLGQVKGLRIAARTSVFAFKGKGVDVREVGEKLAVASVLEGSVRRAGSRLRIVVQLISAADGYQLWSSTYDRELEDVFSLQEEIARAVAAALRVQLTGEQEAPKVRSSTRDVDAYNLYLKGRYFWNKRTPEALQSAVGFFEQAIAADAEYALAYAGLADSYAILIDHGVLPARETLPRVEQAARRALALDETLAEAHTSLALAYQFGWNWEGAEREFQNAVRLNPSYTVAHHRYALLLGWLGRFEESLTELRQAQERDPLSLVVSASTGWILYNRRHFDAAIEEYRKTLAIEPGFVLAHTFWGLALVQVGQYDEAVERLESARRLSGGSAVLSALLGYAYGRGGDLDQAREQLAAAEAQAAKTYVSPYYLAVARLGIGDTAGALDCLEQGFREGCAHLLYIGVEPIFDPLRDDERFQRLVRESGVYSGPLEVVLA